MDRRKGLLGLGVAGLLLAAGTAPATAATPSTAVTAGGFTSTIYSAATNACVDVPGGTTDISTNLVTTACTGAAEQQFTFAPVAGRASTYTLVNVASGQCEHIYRSRVQQQSCSLPAPDPTWDEWTLVPVNAAAHQYQLEPTVFVGSSSIVDVVSAHVAAPGYSSAPLTLNRVVGGNAGQTFVIAGAA